MLVRTLAPLYFLLLGRDVVVSRRESEKRELKPLVPSDELADELALEAELLIGVVLNPLLL